MVARLATLIVVLVAVGACGQAAQGNLKTSSARGSTQPALTAAPSAKPTVPPGSGGIAGHVSYPAGSLPAETVYALAVDSTRYYTVQTAAGQRAYAMVGVAPGAYYVLSAPMTLGGFDVVSSDARAGLVLRFPTGYTRAVVCGLTASCTDHSLIPIQIIAGQTTVGIDPTDWLPPLPIVFPLIPNPGGVMNRPGVPDIATIGNPPFQTAKRVVADHASAETASILVASASDCPYDVACVYISGERDGQGAAYFTLVAGANGTTETCVMYLIDSSTGWEELGFGGTSTTCSESGTPFPNVGSSGQITMPLGESGCVNIHNTPNLTAKVLACLSAGTNITLDDGPVYTPASLSGSHPDYGLEYWWHIAARGWVVNTYVVTYHYG